MAEACPILTPEQRRAAEILHEAQQTMLDKVHAAVAEAVERVGERLLAAGLDLEAPSKTFYESIVHQQMYLALCGAKAGGFEGGNARTAISIIRNEQLIASTYWGADIDVLPQSGARRS